MRTRSVIVELLKTAIWCIVSYRVVQVAPAEVLEIERHCISACPFQQINRTDIGDFDYGCNQSCKIEQCGHGCRLWRLSLKSSCRDICNGTEDPLPPRQLHCVIGCNEASTRYFSQLRDRIQVPPAPALVPDSLTATSLRLKWNFPEDPPAAVRIAAAGGLSYLVQWRYEELADTWQYCRNQTWNAKEDTVFVDELQPYTKYRFRVALLLSSYKSKLHHSELIVSEPSVVILTRSAGRPASAPAIVRAVPEIPAEQQYYTFRNLKASENYSISLQMRNEVGVGPASHIIVSTPIQPTVKDNEKLVLILRTDHKIFEQGTEISDEPKELYATEENIEGIALHVAEQLLFLSDSAGYVHRMTLNATRPSNLPIALNYKPPSPYARPILTPTQTAYAAPSLLSIDWLNGQLYVLGEVREGVGTNGAVGGRRWQVIRCGLDGGEQTVAVAGLTQRPRWMEVDPYNGFLFWVIHSGTKSGLYRLDLTNISNGIKHDVHPQHILSESNLGAFTIDHNNFRLLISYQNNSTVYSVSLDGKEVYNIRKKVATSRMEKITSLAYTNKKFYWTNDSRLFYEEYHEYTDSYYQNSYPDFNNAYKTVLVNLASAQPIPIPVNPPRAVQAIFGAYKAKVSWQAPHLLGGQGRGAWQNWLYELAIKDVQTSHVDTSHRNISTTSHTLYDLLPNRQYVIKASAYTDHGTGPWSSEFSGRTLHDNEDHRKSPVLFWATNEGLLQSDATGDEVVTLLDTTVKTSNVAWKGSYFTDMAWFRDQLYLVSNGSKVLWFNATTRKSGEIFGIGSVGSIAIDWIGKKLYWSNPQKQLINRGNLDGSQQEPLPIITLAKELNIDSINAYLYWSSGYSVECAHLNGANKFVYHPAELFDKQVMGLTLDTDHHYVYWIVRGADGSHLYRAPMMAASHSAPTSARADISSNNERLSYNLPRSGNTMRGPLRYFHGRLLWLGDDRRAVIGDLRENKTAVVAGDALSGLNMVYVVDEELYKLPNTTLLTISVIPEAIDGGSIKIQGSWQSFNVTWNAAVKVNFGTVFYEIKIDTDLITNDTAVITTSPSIRYHRTIPPYTPLHITIRPYTYYSTSIQPPPTHLNVRSPESTPGPPGNLRAYVTHLQMGSLLAVDIRVTFRWTAPAKANGLINGYRVRCWFKEHDGDRMELCEGVVIKGVEEYVLGELLENETYYFQVQAYTSIGDGESSPVLSISTASQYPVPTLILTGQDSIYRLDVDNNSTKTILANVPTPIELAYLLTENRLFWINDANELFMYNTETANKTKILIEEDNLRSISVDWLERAVYYVRWNSNDSTICKVDINRLDRGILKKDIIVHRHGQINKVEVSPFTQRLFWTELDQNDTITLQTSHINGANITQLFTKRKDHKREILAPVSKCDCPNIGDTISKSFTLDHFRDKNNPSLIIIDTKKNEILASDTDACNCNIISTKVTNNIINDIKIDQVYIYWTSKMNLYIVNRSTGELMIKERLYATDVRIFGTHMQPYPNTECLMPKVAQNLTVALINSTSHSVVLSMPSYVPHDDCQHVTIAAIEYHIYYRPYNFNNTLKIINPHAADDALDNLRCNETCRQEVSFDRNVTVKNLLPYSEYIFAVSMGNYFTDISKRKVIVGQGIVHKTAVGAPTHARHVTATVLMPNLISVCWTAPRHLNGDRVHYEVHWETDGRATTGIRQKGDLIYLDDSQLLGNNDDIRTTKVCEHRALLKDLTPDENYIIGVRSFSSRNQTMNAPRDRVQIRTFPEPDNITVVDIKPYELVLQWNITNDTMAYNMQFALLTSTTWENISTSLFKKDPIKNIFTVSVPTLTAKTFYKFRLILKYPLYNQLYSWPKDHRFTFETLGDKPTAPGTPLIQHINEIYQVSWAASKPNGAQIEEYLLQMMKLRNYRVKRNANGTAYSYFAPSIEETEFEWETAYNGTDIFWKMEGLTEKYKYVFRVKARNSYGWSNFSAESVEFDWSSATQLAEKQDYTIIMIAVFVMIVLIFMAIFCGLVACNCCRTNKKSEQVIVASRGPDVELATLRELPRRSNFIHNTNVLYISTQISPEQITLLPHIRRDQITLTKFLGSGAFGEVFEGTAKGCANMHGNAETKVAVKTLRKGATEQEKMEFLQEAQLMSHFKHEHILQLLGVCLDNDPHFIIMELMQGGDLLTYLRLSRKSNTSSPPLTLLDLVRMCLDVAKGCRYLEEMHFVHRDLACRNCLVSSTDPNNRIVKIGDFGLARDIYKNDYYRKEGEGLLPVRWMAPESLVDGVFTCQSDVWAFGVLLWEIMTLGQQPYPARNNLEVLHYVRRGGRLGKPIDCPEDLHALMLKCWNYEGECRPTFKHCLEILERLYLDLLSNPVAAIHTGQYISTVPLRNSWKSGSESDTSRERTPFLSDGLQEPPTGEIPKYLELLYDGDPPPQNGGYEVARTVPFARSVDSAKLSDNNNVNNNLESNVETCKSVDVDVDILKKMVDTSVGYTNMTPERNKIINSETKN